MADLPSPLKIGTDIAAVASAVGAYLEAKRDFDAHPNDPNAASVLLAAQGVVATAAIALAGDASKYVADSKWGALAKLAGLATAVANLETFVSDWQALDDPEVTGEERYVKRLDMILSGINAVVATGQFFADLSGNEEIGIPLAALSALISVVQWGINNRTDELFQDISEFFNGHSTSVVGVIGGAYRPNADGTIATTVVVSGIRIPLANHSGVVFLASGDVGNANDSYTGIYFADNGKAIRNYILVNENTLSYQGNTTAAGRTQSVYSGSGLTVLISASTTDGSISLKVGNTDLAVAPGSRVSFSPAAPGSSNLGLLTIASDGSTIGQQYVVHSDESLGSPVAVQVDNVHQLSTSIGFNVNLKDAAPSVGNIIGSALGNLLAHGNQVEGIVYSSLLGTLGKDLAAQLVGNSDASNAMPTASAQAFNSYLGQVGTQIVSGGAGLIGNTLFMELGQALGLSNFGAQLLGNVGSSVASRIASNVLAGGLSNAWNGFSPQHIFDSSNGSVQAGAGSAAAGAVASFLGSSLGRLVVNPQTQAAGFLSSLGSSIGSWALTTESLSVAGTTLGVSLFGNSWLALNVIAPGVGAFVGFVLGALIGNLFGHKKPKIPGAGAETVLSLPYAHYKLGAVTSSNNGSTNEVIQMADSAADILNGLIQQVTGAGATAHFVSNTTSPTQTYGYTGSQLYVKLNGIQYNVNSANEAVDKGVLWAIPQTQIIGGDLFVKRALANANAPDLANLSGDIQTAKDYENYLNNKTLINSYITGAYSSLSQAEQDFYANNKALVDKADMYGVSALDGNQASIYYSNRQTVTNIIAAIKNQSIANPWMVTLESVSELRINTWSASDFYGGLRGFLQSFGMGLTDAVAHYEDVRLWWDGTNLTITDNAAPGLFSILSQANSDGTSVTIGSFNSVMSGAAAVGWNILYGDGSVHAAATDSWIQAGDANGDVLYGGGGKDVILAGAGNTTIYGGNGDSYLAAGAGSDNVYAGSGANTIVAGSGTANLNGGSNGNTTFIGYQGGGWVWFWGSGSNNTASFERWTGGVNIDLSAYYGFNWAPTAVVYQNVGLQDIQNLIGSAAGGNTLKTGGSGGTLEGGAGNDTFIGVSGGITSVSFANSGGGVYVDLSTGRSFGGSSNGDVFNNIKNVTGSGFDDELKGVWGSVLNGGSAGDDWFIYSGGHNTYIGSVDGNNTVDYSNAPGHLDVALSGASGGTTFSDGTVDSLQNISAIIGGRDGTDFSDFAPPNTLRSYFTPGGGTNGIYGYGVDTIELDTGAGQTQSYANVNKLFFGFGNTFDDIWASYTTISTTTETRFWDYDYSWNDYDTTTSSSGISWTFGIRGTTDSVSGGYYLPSINMDGASTLDLGNIVWLAGPSVEDSGYSYTFAQDYYGTYDIYNWWDNITTTANGSLGSNVSGTNYGGSLILAGGGASYINVDNGSTTSNGSVVIAGQAAASGLVINTSSGDDQFTFERGDGHYIIYGTGGQKTIDFGPSVGTNDVLYKVVGNDLYIGVEDVDHPALTADQVSDNIRIVNGAIKYVYDSGNPTWPNQYFIQVGGSSIDLTKVSITWVQQHVSGQGAAPIVFDLNNDGLELTPVAKSDIVTRNADGIITRVGWVGPTNGVLVADHNRDGQINSLSDISFINDKSGATTDLEGLAGWDTNGDGVVDAQDTGWSQLKMWVDANVDGQAEAGEIKSLDDLGIASISLKGKPTGNTAADSSDSFVTNTTTFERTDGTTGHAYDVTLRRQFLGAAALEDVGGMTWAAVGPDGQIGQMLTSPGKIADGESYGSLVAQGSYNFSGTGTTSVAAAALWTDFLDPAKDAARKAQLATGHIGDTSSMKDTSVQTLYANRGAHHQTQRIQVLDLDLNGAGPQTINAGASGVKQDVDLTGNPYGVGWVGAEDGLLVIDAINDGNIDAPTEATFQNWLPKAKTSLEGLAAFDTNSDGAIDAGDKVFNSLRIWTDSNGDGVSETGELKSVSDLGIKSFALSADTSNADTKTLGDNEILTASTVTMIDGTTHRLYDVALGVDKGIGASTPDPTTTQSTDSPAATAPNVPTVTDATGSAAGATAPTDTLKTQLDSTAAGVAAQSAGSAGPSGEVMTSEPVNASSAGGWWDANSGQGLSDAINTFKTADSKQGDSQAPVSSANDAAMIQRHLFLRQVIAGFTVHGSAPAIFSRQGGLDTQSTLAAATGATKPTSSVTSAAA